MRQLSELDDEWHDRDRWREWLDSRIADDDDLTDDELTALTEREIDRILDSYLDVAEIDRRRARAHDERRSTIAADLPPESERPTAVMIAAADIEETYAYTMSAPGFLTAHTRPLGLRDAFDGSVESNTVVDYETLLEADPDVILHLGGMEPNTAIAERRTLFAEDPVASQISAVDNDRVYAQGARYQGPILNLFQFEMTAKQLYPDTFGAWPTYEAGPYPEIPTEEHLFDRQRVADAITGDV